VRGKYKYKGTGRPPGRPRREVAESVQPQEGGGVDYEEAVGQKVDDDHFIARLVNALEHNATAQAGANGPKPITAAERAARLEARDKMEAMLDDLKGREVFPRYRLTTEQFQGDELIPATMTNRYGVLIPTEIDFQGIPNETMVPVNESAKKVHALFMQSMGGSTPELSDQSMEAYLNRPGKVRVVGAAEPPPPLGTPSQGNKARIVDQGPEAAPLSFTPQMGTVQHTPGRL
jgi:hypothetical protein